MTSDINAYHKYPIPDRQEEQETLRCCSLGPFHEYSLNSERIPPSFWLVEGVQENGRNRWIFR